jgi:hypothetical protein
MGKRMAIYYSSTALSGAFSGLLAYGIFHIQSTRIQGWQILFLIEGGLTVIVATVAFFVLPSYPQEVTFLTPEQKKVAIIRLLKDSSAEVNSAFDKKEFFRPLREWRFYLCRSHIHGLLTDSTDKYSGHLRADIRHGSIDGHHIPAPDHRPLWLLNRQDESVSMLPPHSLLPSTDTRKASQSLAS